jgi:hypothetical protein
MGSAQCVESVCRALRNQYMCLEHDFLPVQNIMQVILEATQDRATYS